MVVKKGLLGLMGVSALVAGVVVPVGDVGVSAAEPTAEQYFTFDSSTGTITGYNAVGGGKDVVIPSKIGGVAVTEIGDKAFFESQLTSVVIPGSVKSIGYWAFFGNKLTSVMMNEGLESIGERAFFESQLTSVVIPGSVKSIEKFAFYGNSIINVELNEGLESIGETAFYSNNIEDIKIPVTVNSIGNSAFLGNPLKRVDVGGTPTMGANIFNPESPRTSEDVPIYGIAGSTVETYANTNRHPFNPIEGDDNTGDDNSSGTASSRADQNVQLKINAGDLYLDAPEIVDFGEVTLGDKAKVIGTQFTDSFKVTDARGTGEGWKLTVKATNFKEVEPTGGFKEGTGGYELPHGSLTITSEVAVEQLNGNKGILPSKELSSSVVIDAESPDSVLISQAGVDEGMGTFGYSYGEGALKLVVDPSTAKIDRANYGGVATPYESTVTWELVSGL